MKKVKNLLLIAMLIVGGMSVTSCTDYQDEIDALDFRVTALEELVDKVNTNIKGMETIIKAFEEGDYIKDVIPTTNGYAIEFGKNGIIYIYDGEDAQSPDIDVVQDPTDGQWYWTVNGVPLTDSNGNKIRANGNDGKNGKDGAAGKDGADGKDGKDGKDAISPQVRINPATHVWEISVDGGNTWIPTGTSATGKDGKDGKDGENGKDGNQIILKVTYEVDSDGKEWMIITTKAQTFRIPVITD
jgi:hypothetical protein